MSLRRRRVIGPSFPFLATRVSAAAPPAAYVGPLDLFGSATGAWGVRALSSAFRGQNIVRVVDTTTHIESNFICDAVTGNLDTAAITTFLGGHIGRYITFYDQSGGSNHILAVSEGDAYDFSASPNAAESSTGAAACFSTSAITLTQPFALSAVFFQGESSGNYPLVTFESDTPREGFRVGSYLFIDTNAGEIPRNSTAASGTWLASQALFNGASSKLLVNGAAATGDGNLGTGNTASKIQWGYGWHSASGINPSYVRELIAWDSDPGDTLRASIEANQRTHWTF